MLKLLSTLFRNAAEIEQRQLAELRRSAAEVPDWSAAVQAVLTRLLTRNGIARPMESIVLQMPFNALALPHKTIVVAQSLVEFCRDETDQMAFVMAHEAAHIHLGHASKRSQVNTLTSLLGTAHPLAGMGLRFLLDRAFSREQEFEADRVAVTMCHRAGYEPRVGIAFLERLRTLDPTTGVGLLLSSHPPTEDRVAELRTIIGA